MILVTYYPSFFTNDVGLPMTSYIELPMTSYVEQNRVTTHSQNQGKLKEEEEERV